MKAWRKGLSAALCAAGIGALVGVSGCSSSSSGGGGGGDAFASGTAVKGRVADGMVTVFELRRTGALGRVLGVGTTSPTGEFSVPIPADEYSGWAVACVTSGTFVDEATGIQQTITQDAPLYGFADVQVTSTDYAITPVTTIALSLMQFYAHDPEATVEDSVENAFTAVENYFGLQNVDIDLPADLTAGTVAAGPQADNAIVIAGISKLAETATVPTMEMVQALARDAQDGSLDGQSFGEDVPLGAGTLSPDAGTTELAAAIVAFLGSPENASGLTDADTLVDDDLAASLGDFDKPIQIQGLVNGFGTVSDVIDARLEALAVPANPQISIEAQILTVTNQDARVIDFEIPAGLALGLHDLVVTDQDSGVTARVRDAIEVFDPDAVPTVSEITPDKGPLTGGTFLQVWGTNFGPDTEVQVGGVLAERLAQDFPRWMVVATPEGAEGSVDVTVRNGPASQVVVANAFEYVIKDARINPSLPSPLTTIVFGAFRNFVDEDDGFTAQALTGRSTFTSFDQGNFTLTDFTTTELAPQVVTRQRSGASFQSNESLAKAFLLFDSVNQTSDFIRGFTNEENGVSLGATAFGPACFFAEPSNVPIDAAVGSYWVNGFEANIGLNTLRQKAGWIELDASLAGSASFMTHEREYDGASFGLSSEKWRLNYNLTATGSFTATRFIGDDTDNLSGSFNDGADFGFLTHTDKDGTIGYYLLTRIEHGVESAGFGGWTGGYLEHEIADEGAGDESFFESGAYRGLIGGTAEGSSRLAFNRATRLSPSNTDGCFSEYVGAVNLDVSPSGRMFSDDNLVGYVSVYDGILLATGSFPNECVQDAATDRPMVIGGATFRESRQSHLSLDSEPVRKQVSIEAKLLEVGTTHYQEVGTDYFDVTLDVDAPPTVGGVDFSLAGTIPELEAATITGVHKSTVRDESGAVATVRGDPPAYGVRMGFTFIDDTLDLFATEITEAGRFDDATMPRWVGSGTLGDDGQVAALRTSDEFLGDGLIVLVANPGAALTEPNYEMQAVGLAYEPNSGGLSEATSSAADLDFVGNGTVATTVLSHSMAEDGLFSSGSTAGLGLNTAPAGQRMRINIPTGGGPDLEWETVFSPDGSFFAGIDDTPGLDLAGIVLGIRPATSGSFVDDDRALIGLEFDPQISRGTSLQLQLKPRVGSLMTGEIFTSRRDGAHKVLPGQSFVSTTATDVGPGVARVPFVGQIPVLNFFYSEKDDAVGQEDLTLSITPRIVFSFGL
jgi:hypothetical protein